VTQSGEFQQGRLYDGKWYRYNSDGLLIRIEITKAANTLERVSSVSKTNDDSTGFPNTRKIYKAYTSHRIAVAFFYGISSNSPSIQRCDLGEIPSYRNIVYADPISAPSSVQNGLNAV
jgi:hypothetical protein